MTEDDIELVAISYRLLVFIRNYWKQWNT